MVSILSMKGHQLILKTIVNETSLAMIKRSDFFTDEINIEELEALGERHLGCGHDL